MSIPERIAAVRSRMKIYGLDAYLLGSTDPHQSEYVAAHWQSRQWLSGFDGSAGTLIITATEACLWTDSRYFLQAETQLQGSGIRLMKLQVPHTPEYLDWLAETLKENDTLGFDGQVVSLANASKIDEALQAQGIRIDLSYDLPGEVWTDRPPLPNTPPYEHPAEFVGKTRAEKLAQMRSFLRVKGLDHYLLTALDEIAWLLNIRAADVDYNPLCVSYLLVKSEGEHLFFVGSSRLTPIRDLRQEQRSRLKQEGIALADYEDVFTELYRIAGTEELLGLDPDTAAAAIYLASDQEKVEPLQSPIPAWKARKDPKEIAHLRQAMARDGIALLKLRRWLDAVGIPQAVAENEIAEQLAYFRSQGDHYKGESFPAIVGYKGNGAIVHYHPQKGSAAQISAEGLLLLDSGGQYLDGTTDTTRTFALGEPSEAERLHFTLVLQGHIDLAMARFPKGTTGVQLDILARGPLWQHGLNYGHGTGHGVGYFLNVHEGPMGISPNAKAANTKVPLEPGMIISNEPAFYQEGAYGIRTENLVLVVEEQAGWLAFETLTLFPIEKGLIQTERLSPAQRQWLNAYHARVEATLSPLLEDAEAEAWLQEACAAI